MPKISMDTDVAQAAVQMMQQSAHALTDQLNQLAQSVEALRSSWKGNAQAEFSELWEQWRQGFAQTIEQLTPITVGVQREKEELEQADASSSYH